MVSASSASSASHTTPIMVGGAKFQESVLEWSKKSTNLYTVVFAALLIAWALYADKLPTIARWQLSTTVGRLLLLLLLYVVYELCGWTVALIFTIAVALTWAARPIFMPVDFVSEGFNDMKITEVGPTRWFVEKILHQNPKKIVEDRIDTMAINDNTTVSARS